MLRIYHVGVKEIGEKVYGRGMSGRHAEILARYTSMQREMKCLKKYSEI